MHVCICCVMFYFLSAILRDWLQRMSLKLRAFVPSGTWNQHVIKMETDSCNGCNVICQCMSVDDHLPILLSRPRSQISKGLGLGLKVKFKSSFTGRIIDNIHMLYCIAVQKQTVHWLTSFAVFSSFLHSWLQHGWLLLLIEQWLLICISVDLTSACCQWQTEIAADVPASQTCWSWNTSQFINRHSCIVMF